MRGKLLMKLTLHSTLIALLLLAATQVSLAQVKEDSRLLLATQVVEEVNGMPDQNVPAWLLERAYGVAVIPAVVKVGLVLGGRRGKGVLVVRRDDGSWSNPVFVTLTGGSFGWQAGVQEADIILVFTTKAGVEGITDGKLTLGADASVAAGPVGRATSAATDANFSAEVYSYSRTRGLFAGIAIDGSAITIDKKANEAYYQKSGVTASDIIAPTAPAPPAAAQRFVAAVGSSATRTASGAPAAEKTPASSSSPSAAPAAEPPPANTGVKTFPMEDPNPGQPPPG
jgi:lipid-binding SYLF domain-containing protein